MKIKSNTKIADRDMTAESRSLSNILMRRSLVDRGLCATKKVTTGTSLQKDYGGATERLQLIQTSFAQAVTRTHTSPRHQHITLVLKTHHWQKSTGQIHLKVL